MNAYELEFAMSECDGFIDACDALDAEERRIDAEFFAMGFEEFENEEEDEDEIVARACRKF